MRAVSAVRGCIKMEKKKGISYKTVMSNTTLSEYIEEEESS